MYISIDFVETVYTFFSKSVSSCDSKFEVPVKRPKHKNSFFSNIHFNNCDQLIVNQSSSTLFVSTRLWPNTWLICTYKYRIYL